MVLALVLISVQETSKKYLNIIDFKLWIKVFVSLDFYAKKQLKKELFSCKRKRKRWQILFYMGMFTFSIF